MEERKRYNGEFTVEERKNMTAEMLQKLRKDNKLSQKEVAAKLNIPATTYNTYESGRTEPPLEMLVRLSWLYAVPIDIIVQKDRLITSAEDVEKTLAQYKEQIASFDREIEERGIESPGLKGMLAVMERLTNALNDYSQTEAAQKALSEKGKK